VTVHGGVVTVASSDRHDELVARVRDAPAIAARAVVLGQVARDELPQPVNPRARPPCGFAGDSGARGQPCAAVGEAFELVPLQRRASRPPRRPRGECRAA